MIDAFSTEETASQPHEIKAFGPEIKALHDDYNRTFEDYKDENDHRLAQLEQRMSSDVLTQDKLVRLDRALDDIKRRMDHEVIRKSRPALSANETAWRRDDREHKQAFHSYLRSGEANGLKALEEKALSIGSGPDGGYLVPPSVEDEVLRRLSFLSPIRSIASVRMTSGGLYKRAVSTTGYSAGWVGETAARPQTNNATLAEQSYPAMELYAMPAATQALLDDAVVDIDRWIADEVEQVFAEQEGTAFVSGDGVNKPKGFLAEQNIIDASWTWGKLGFTKTGVSGGFPVSNPSDILVDLIYSLRAGYRQNASFVMNRKVQAAIRKFKDTTGNYIWQPPAAVGAPASLMGFPVVEAEDMPDMALDSLSIAFGDFRRGYLVVDRKGLRILRDPFSAKPYVLFYTTKRVGGGVQDYAAIKLLKFGI